MKVKRKRRMSRRRRERTYIAVMVLLAIAVSIGLTRSVMRDDKMHLQRITTGSREQNNTYGKTESMCMSTIRPS